MQIVTEKGSETTDIQLLEQNNPCVCTHRGPFQCSKLRQQCIYSTVVMQRKTPRLLSGRPWLWPRSCCVPNNGRRRQRDAHRIFLGPTRIPKHSSRFNFSSVARPNGRDEKKNLFYLLPCHYWYLTESVPCGGNKAPQKQAVQHCCDFLARVKNQTERADRFFGRWSQRLEVVPYSDMFWTTGDGHIKFECNFLLP